MTLNAIQSNPTPIYSNHPHASAKKVYACTKAKKKKKEDEWKVCRVNVTITPIIETITSAPSFTAKWIDRKECGI
jgi:hypothetical protein